MSVHDAAYDAGRRDALDEIEKAVGSCPSLDCNGYITEKKYVIQAIHQLRGLQHPHLGPLRPEPEDAVIAKARAALGES